MSEIRNYNNLFRLDGKIALVTGGAAPSPLPQPPFSY
jgi:hypothetical protein